MDNAYDNIEEELKKAVQRPLPNCDEIFKEIKREREYQNYKWGNEFDDKNTSNDWIAYIAAYLGQVWTCPFNAEEYRKNLIKVAALAVAAVETYDRLNGEIAKTHYDE